ncbi:MAG: hypothetical protein AB1631_00500 [Acidobacteriota bacterium]
MRTVRVECYAGSRADERPRRVVIDGREHTVARILNTSIEESAATKERIRRYTVLTQEGMRLKIIQAGDEWFLE